MSGNCSSVMQSYEITKFFPFGKVDYEGRSADDITLHYHILYGKVQQIADWVTKYSQWLCHPEEITRLTPIHMCAITNSYEAAQKIIQAVQVEDDGLLAAQDFRGWTPLHHAALLKDGKILTLFLQALKESSLIGKLTNNNGGTYRDLRKMAFPIEIPGHEVVCRCKTSGKIIDCTAKMFSDVLGAQFTRCMHATPSLFAEQWALPHEIISSERRYTIEFQKEYKAYKITTPPLYFELTDAGYGVFAEEEIQPWSIVTDYLGQGTFQFNDSLYATTGCDGENVRNLGPMINDGFPNCVDVALGGVRGFPLIRILVATRTIQPGEQILWNYGAHHSVKLGRYVQFASSNAIEDEFRESLLDKYARYSKELHLIGHETAKTRAQLSCFHYLFVTPSFQLIGLLNGMISIDELYTLRKHYLLHRGEEFKFEQADCHLFIAKRLQGVAQNHQERTNLVSKVEFLFSQYEALIVIKFLAFLVLNPEDLVTLRDKLVDTNKEGLARELENLKTIFPQLWQKVESFSYENIKNQ